MTSSWLLKNRKLHAQRWGISNFGDPDNALGGWEDHYLIPGGTKECHPDYVAHPIGSPYGFMMCVKRKFPNGQGLDAGPTMCPFQPADNNGMKKFTSDLYDPHKRTQSQMYNPDNYYNRTTPNEEYLHRFDYLARPMWYDGTGVHPIHTPGPRRYNEYGFSYTTLPPYKYDVQRLQQPYPVWKREQEFQGRIPERQISEFDRTTPSVTMGVL